MIGFTTEMPLPTSGYITPLLDWADTHAALDILLGRMPFRFLYPYFMY